MGRAHKNHTRSQSAPGLAWETLVSAVTLGLSPGPRLGTLLPRVAGVTGGRRSTAKASVAVGSADAGGGTAKVFPKDKRLAVLLLGPRTSKAAARCGPLGPP